MTTSSARFQATLIGSLRVTTPEGEDVTPRARKSAAIVAYLLLSGSSVARRERLASLLWSEKGEQQARDSLRQCLVELRRSPLVPNCVAITAREVEVRPALLPADVSELQHAVEQGDAGTAARLLHGDDLTLLAGYDDLDPAFADWLVIERERWSQALAADLLRLVRSGAATQRDRLALTEAILRLDPYQEEAVEITMRSLAGEGTPAAAVTFFDRYQRSLRREYEVEPSRELVALADGLRRVATAGAGGPARPPPSASPVALAEAPATLRPLMPPPRPREPPRIAVLVGVGTDNGADLEYVADAFRHDLMATLARFKEWVVTALPPEEASLPADRLEQLARQGIDYTLHALLYAHTGGTRVEVRVSECEPRGRVLEERYHMAPGRWIGVLNDICCRVGAWLQVAISTARLRLVADRTPEQRSAYDLWLEGHHLTSLWTRAADKAAERLLERAIGLDPQLAPAYGSLASILHTRHLVWPGWPRTAEDRERALVLARRAVELDRMDCRGHVMLGWAHTLARRFDNADFHFRLALELNPSNPNVFISAGSAASFSGAHDEAKRLAARAFELNPVPPGFYFGYRARIAFFTGDLEQCIADVAKTPDIFPSIRMWAAAALVRLGRQALARRELEACYTAVRERWAGSTEPDRHAAHEYLRNLHVFRRQEDRHLVVSNLDAAAEG